MAVKPILFVLGIVGLMGGLAAQSPAQLRELMSTRDGSGSLRYRERSSVGDVNRVAVRLYRDGDAAIEIVSGARETFRGFWRNDGSRRVRVTINKVGRDSAYGSGTVEHDGRGSLTRVNLDGSVGRTRYELDFDAGRTGGGTGSGSNDEWITELNASQRGRGSLDYRSRSSNVEVELLRVRLTRDHRFEIFPAGTRDVFKGRWWHDGRRTIRLDLDQVRNDSATGSGTLELDSHASFRTVNLSGRVSGAEFRLNFTTNMNSGSWGSSSLDGDDREFRDAARRAVVREFTAGTAFSWSDERVSSVSFGQRVATGSFRARNGNRPGSYTYRVVLGAGSMSVRSVSVNKD